MLNNIKTKRIGVDARFYGPIGKGLGRYTKEVVDRIVAFDHKNEYLVFLYKENFYEFKSENPNVKKVLVKTRWYSVAEQVVMPYLIWREKINLMHFPHFNVPLLCPVKFIVTIHDLILTKYPTQRASTLSPTLYKIKYFLYKFVIKTAIRKAKKIIAVSEFTKNDIIKQFGTDKNKIIVTYEGVAKTCKQDLKKNDKNVLIRYNIHKPYLLYVGNAYPHKNLEYLINIFPKLRDKYKNLSLILVSKDDYFYKRLKSLVKKNKSDEFIIFPGFIPDNDLSTVYSNAESYIFPSLYEGFGLPPLEAMANGCPVLSSDSSSIPEILEDAAIYFNPRDEKDIIKQVEVILNDKNLRSELINKGYKQAEKYSWDRCAELTLSVYSTIIKNNYGQTKEN